MSDLRIALVAEGPTDYEVIHAALRAILDRHFVLSKLQPEPTRPDRGAGWGGVFKWCKEFRTRGKGSIEADPTLSGFDLLIIHLDADVAGKSYADYGHTMAEDAAHLGALPCACPCPPAADSVAALESVLLSWLGLAATGPKSVFCIPSKSTEAWLASAMLPDGHDLLHGVECRLDLETRLAHLPRAYKTRKSARDYKLKAPLIHEQWQRVTTLCGQASLFDSRTKRLVAAIP